MIKNHKNILYTLIGIILIFFGYWYFVISKKDTTKTSRDVLVPVTSAQNTTKSNQKSYDREFVTSLQAIQYVNLDTSILQSAAYAALSYPEIPFQVDYNIPVGRRNPFLPIGSETSRSSSVSPVTNEATTSTPVKPPTTR